MFERFFLKKCFYECMISFWMHIWCMFEWFFFLWENAFMKSWTFSFWKCIYECMIFFNAYIVHVWMNFLMRKYIYEILDFFFLKMHLWMHEFFLNAYIMHVWKIFSKKKENAFMNAWFLFECIYDVCLNDFFFIYEKIHLWNFGLFVFENAFMNVWFFLEWFWFFFEYGCMHNFF